MHVLHASRGRVHRRTVAMVMGDPAVRVMHAVTAVVVVVDHGPVMFPVLDVLHVVPVGVHVHSHMTASRGVHRRTVMMMVAHMTVVVMHRHAAVVVVLDLHPVSVLDPGDVVSVGMVMRMNFGCTRPVLFQGGLRPRSSI